MALANYRAGRCKLGIDYLRKYLRQFDALAEAARKANDPAFTRWGKVAVEIARELATYETPKLSAVMVQPPPAKTTRFPLAIFDAERRPLVLEAQPAPAPAPSVDEAKPVDGEVIAPEPAKPAEESKPPEAKPGDPPPNTAGNGHDDADARLVWRRAQQWNALFQGRGPRGSWHG